MNLDVGERDTASFPHGDADAQGTDFGTLVHVTVIVRHGSLALIGSWVCSSSGLSSTMAVWNCQPAADTPSWGPHRRS